MLAATESSIIIQSPNIRKEASLIAICEPEETHPSGAGIFIPLASIAMKLLAPPRIAIVVPIGAGLPIGANNLKTSKKDTASKILQIRAGIVPLFEKKNEKIRYTKKNTSTVLYSPL